MASLYKRGACYYAQWHNARRAPQKIRLSLRTRSRTDAKRLISLLDRSYVRGEWDPWIESIDKCLCRTPEPKRYSFLVEEFLSEKKVVLADTTLVSYRSALDLLGQQFESANKKIEAITASDLRSALYGFDVSETTRRQRYRTVRVFFNWCREREYIRASPLVGVPTPRPVESNAHSIRWDELLKICKVIESDYQAKLVLPRFFG
ncbi:MAG: hypothetical protein IH853_09395 [Bacteroidetes bacterium]|nr:hypothetical protein [Bacteroidota bacterium]